ncbi:MAG: acyl-CoA dehydrogenase family protein [Parvibaculales bacterium]
MDFQLTDEQKELQATARKFARNEMPAIAEKCETSGQPVDKKMLKKLGDMGFLGINIPQDLGGLGLGNLEALLVLEEFAKISSASAFPLFEANVGPVHALVHFAPDELKRQIVPQICAGEMMLAVSMSEPQAGSALTDLTTRGIIKNGEIILNGQKRWCSGGGHADGYLVYCRLSDDAGAKAIGAVYVPKDAAGVRFGAQEELMGFRGVPSADIFLDDVRLPEAHIVVAAGGFRKLMEAFDLERCGNATMALAQASGALEDVLDYVQQREQFGKALVEFQAVQMKLAEMQMRVEAARLLIHRAAVNAENGLPNVGESSTAKCFANEISREVTGMAVQLMGGYGYAKAYPMERRMRDAWGWGIAGGAIDIQKTNIAAAMVGRRFDQRL